MNNKKDIQEALDRGGFFGAGHTVGTHALVATPAQNINDGFKQMLQALRDNKPTERNETARRYAVTITELEKVAAYFEVYIYNED